jgi:hypothetical protein
MEQAGPYAEHVGGGREGKQGDELASGCHDRSVGGAVQSLHPRPILTL